MERVFTPYPLFSRKERDFYDVSEMRKEPRKGRCPVPGLRRGAGRAVFARHDDRRQNEVLLYADKRHPENSPGRTGRQAHRNLVDCRHCARRHYARRHRVCRARTVRPVRRLKRDPARSSVPERGELL